MDIPFARASYLYFLALLTRETLRQATITHNQPKVPQGWPPVPNSQGNPGLHIKQNITYVDRKPVLRVGKIYIKNIGNNFIAKCIVFDAFRDF